jgi:hypothetical protein
MSKKLAICLAIGASVLLIGNNLSAEVGGPLSSGPEGTGPKGTEGLMSRTINGETVHYTTDQKHCPNCGVVSDDVAKQIPECRTRTCWSPNSHIIRQ